MTTERQFITAFVKDQARIYRFIATLVTCRADAEDLMQAVTISLWERWKDFDPERGAFVAWAMGIAHNHVRNYFRSVERRRKHVVFDEVLVEKMSEAAVEHAELIDEKVEALRVCVEKLPGQQRTLVDQYYRRSGSVGDLARSLELSRNTLLRRMALIRKCLWKCITRQVGREARQA